MNDHDLNELSRAANHDQRAERMGALWRAAFASGSWTLVGRNGARRFEPLTTRYEGMVCVLAFTSSARASAFLAENMIEGHGSVSAGTELPQDGASTEAVSMPVPAAVDLLDELRPWGIECVLVNEGSGPFITPLSELVRLFAVHGLGA